MATLRDLRKRLKAVKNTKKITKAMKMVSASKLKRAQDAIIRARPYALEMNEVVRHILSHADLAGHPLLLPRLPRRIELVIVTSDRGLCGSFNSNIVRAAERFLAENHGRYDEILVSTIGKKGRDHFRRKGTPLLADYALAGHTSFERAEEIAQDLTARFRSGRIDATFLLYNEFKSAISQRAIVSELLPLKPIEAWQAERLKVGELQPIARSASVAGRGGMEIEKVEHIADEWSVPPPTEFFAEGYEHLFEPSRPAVLDALIPQHLAIQVYRAILESTAAEHGARMTAMDAASRNASDMIDRLTLSMNRARQAAITKELMEIISGAESIKG